MRSYTTKDRIEQLMLRLGAAVRSDGRIYFTGGVSAVLMGWREMTIDVDLKAERLLVLFSQVEAQLIRYPAVDATSLRERVLEMSRDSA